MTREMENRGKGEISFANRNCDLAKSVKLDRLMLAYFNTIPHDWIDIFTQEIVPICENCKNKCEEQATVLPFANFFMTT